MIFLLPTLIIFLYLITPSNISSSYEELKSFLLLLSTAIYIFAHHWHHSRQHYGILSLYRRSSQQKEGYALTRDKFFCYLFACFLAPLALFANSFRYRRFFSYFPDVTNHSNVLVGGTILLSLTVTVIFIYFELKNSRRSIPKVFYYLMMLGQIIVISLSPNFFYLALWLISHSIISIGFTLRMHKNYALKNSSSHSSLPAKWWTRLIHGGVFTFLGGLLVYQYAELVPFFFGVLRGREGQPWPPVSDGFFDIIYLSLTSGGVLGLFYLHYAAERFLFLRRKRRSQEAFKLLNFKF